MSSSTKNCILCANNLSLPQDGALKDPANSVICDPCLYARNLKKDESPKSSDDDEVHIFCLENHYGEEGWKKCITCEKEIHTDCIMALYSWTYKGADDIICRDCLKKENCAASNIGSSSSIPRWYIALYQTTPVTLEKTLLCTVEVNLGIIGETNNVISARFPCFMCRKPKQICSRKSARSNHILDSGA